MKFLLSCLLLAAAGHLVLPAWAAEQRDASRAEVRLREWLSAFNSRASIKDHLEQAFSPELLDKAPASMRALFQEARRHETQGYDLRKLVSATPESVSALAQSKLTKLWYRIDLSVQPSPPHRITKYEAPHIPEPKEFRRLVSESQMVDELKNLLGHMSVSDTFSGSVLVAKGGRVLFRRSYGYADRGHSIKNKPNTKFNLASVNKMFTAVAVMQLVAQGRLDLDKPIGQYVRDYPAERVRHTVTARHLLTHMSGLGDYFNERYYAARDNLRAVKDYVPLFADQPLLFEPGTAYEYSNAGFIVLGRLIEAVSGRSYFDYVRDEVFTAAGMADTDCYELDYDTPNLATGYTQMAPDGRPDFTKRRRMLFNEGIKGSPAGHGYSTVDDLFRFCRRFKEGKLVPLHHVKAMTTPQARTGTPGEQHGLGFEILPTDTGVIVGHTGGGRGGMAIVDMYERGDYTVIVLSNYQRGGNLVAYRSRDLIAAISP